MFNKPLTEIILEEKLRKEKFKSWLDNLQQESWQLELLISGFAIFAVFQSFNPFIEFMDSIADKNNNELYFIVFFMLGLCVVTALLILAFNLSVHLLLRGLWIGAIGLRYFSGDIDFKKLNYTKKFDTYLKKKIKSFDNYIAKLEDYCSIIFSLTFLLIFFFFSFMVFAVLLVGLGLIGIENPDSATLKFILRITVIIFLLGSLLTFIDFFTQGYLKKKKWLSFFYFPIYRIFSKISLSFIYRPVLYNFLDNKKGKWILALIVPFYIILALFASITMQESNFHEVGYSDSVHFLKSNNYYDDIIEDETEYVIDAAIAGKIIRSNPLVLFVRHSFRLEDAVIGFNPSLSPVIDNRGLSFANGAFKTNSVDENNFEEFELYLKSLSQTVSVEIDCINFVTDFVAVTNSKDQIGYDTFINIETLEKGKHIININGKECVNDLVQSYTLASFPFWYYPE